jgi:hypothetical protein
MFLFAGMLALAAGCQSAFVSSWRAPDSQPFQLAGSKVAAVVMMSNEASRLAAEQALAREISERGATGIPMYEIFPNDRPENEMAARAALERMGMTAVVVMRPVSVEKEISSTPSTYGGYYGSYWGGYYGHGWGSPWGVGIATGGEVHTDTIVTIETLIYSFRQNKLVWAGQSRTTNPRNVDKMVHRLATDAVKEMQKQGLLPAA